MIHREVKTRLQEVTFLVDYLIRLKVRQAKLFYGLNRNIEFLTKASEEIDKEAKQLYPELFDIEDKAVKLVQPLNEAIEKENAELDEKEKELTEKTTPKSLLTLSDGLAKLSEADQAKHTELMVEYNKLLDLEDDVKTYTLKSEVLDNLELDFWAVRVLSQFIEE